MDGRIACVYVYYRKLTRVVNILKLYHERDQYKLSLKDEDCVFYLNECKAPCTYTRRGTIFTAY